MTATLANQLTWCTVSTGYLKDLSDAITSAEKKVNTTIDMLKQYSFAEFNAPLFPLQAQLQKDAKETQDFIYNSHVSYLENRIIFIAGLLT